MEVASMSSALTSSSNRLLQSRERQSAPRTVTIREGSNINSGESEQENLSYHGREVRKRRELENVAAWMIRRWWVGHQQRLYFELIKDTICRSEKSLTFDILRKLCPTEANLLKDPTMRAKIRFRFGGTTFPPRIFFKIYTQSDTTQYISGKRIIVPGSQAARDACRQMGNRKFLGQMLNDTCHTGKISNEYDVTTMKDCMQYLAALDKSPAYMGGRDNSWRELSREYVEPVHQSALLGVFDYLDGRSSLLEHEHFTKLSSSTLPPTQGSVIDNINAVARYKTALASVKPQSQRRSENSRRRIKNMRQMYGLNSEGHASEEMKSFSGTHSPHDQTNRHQNRNSTANVSQREGRGSEHTTGESDWEEEAEKLFEWAQDIKINSIPP